MLNRNSFTLAEQEIEGGVSPHTSPLAGVADMGNLLSRAQFNLTTGTIVTQFLHSKLLKWTQM
jgi:hypothetical protein